MQALAKNWREWLSRYGIAEICGTIGSYAGFLIVASVANSMVAASYGAALGENCGFYGYIFAREVAASNRAGDRLSVRQARKIGRNIAYEFGTAEILDFFLIRPGATFIAVSLIGQSAGVLVGKVAADLVFYALAIGFYERRKAKRPRV
jgi:hypothetical protein